MLKRIAFIILSPFLLLGFLITLGAHGENIIKKRSRELPE
jgi:hypothetical protein